MSPVFVYVGVEADLKVRQAVRALSSRFAVVDYCEDPASRPGEKYIWIIRSDDDRERWPLATVDRVMTLPIGNVPVSMVITEAENRLKQFGLV